MSETTLSTILEIVLLVGIGSVFVSQLVFALRTGVIFWGRGKYSDASGQRPSFTVDRAGVPSSFWFSFVLMAGMAAVFFGSAAAFLWALVTRT
jgi:hypothetical protein